MIFGTSTGKLFLLLSACAPNNLVAKKRLFQEELKMSTDYQVLLADTQGKHLIPSIVTTPSETESFDAYKTRVFQCISLTLSLLSTMSDAIQHKDCSLIHAADIPDFSSPKSINRVIQKIQSLPQGAGCTNISATETMLLFDDSVTRDASAVLPELTPSQLKVADKFLVTLIPDRKYYISRDLLGQQVQQISRLLEESEDHLIIYRRSVHRRRILKWTLLLFCWAIFCVNSILHFLPIQENALFLLGSTIITSLLLIGG